MPGDFIERSPRRSGKWTLCQSQFLVEFDPFRTCPWSALVLFWKAGGVIARRWRLRIRDKRRNAASACAGEWRGTARVRAIAVGATRVEPRRKWQTAGADQCGERLAALTATHPAARAVATLTTTALTMRAARNAHPARDATR